MKTQHEQPIDPPEAVLTLENKLTADILMMMGGTFDHWHPDANLDEIRARMACAKLAAEGIARKLTETLGQSPALTEEGWNLLVQNASRNAFMEVTEEGPLVKLAENTSFAAAVAACTAATVAPSGSDWALAVAARREEHQRKQLLALGCHPKNIERVIADLRHNGTKPPVG
jgi:hypothetical protein